ncbi:uncharacterized protein MELLADRAFT_104518 [Melampsora larici-populina 98AG31]|uniref:Uncharacterized protein n=1 Tax=Melampsora larici-populina (strain 98AG31 / pathotype 3-4-7) TaxID=747676 RepID=F4REY5_MELLP|nr:uncharacterized protein MELLADRAFT_104518 [Melampsora larici-populina 98AG31]EGG09205.1 hypothetical protein MELLADRAFT_104518 [Melampsora larici-populina 98AG31]
MPDRMAFSQGWSKSAIERGCRCEDECTKIENNHRERRPTTSFSRNDSFLWSLGANMQLRSPHVLRLLGGVVKIERYLEQLKALSLECCSLVRGLSERCDKSMIEANMAD